MPRFADKPLLLALAGTEILVGTSIAGGDADPTGSVAPGADIKVTTSQLRDWMFALLLDNDPALAADSATKAATQQAVKAAIAAALNGLSWKKQVRVATTATGTLATAFENGDTVDGVVLATGDRILIKDQSTPAENGIYVVAATGAPVRATDADSGAELVNATVYVSEGSANADKQFTCTANSPITLGSTALSFAQSGTGNVTSVNGASGTVVLDDGDVKSVITALTSGTTVTVDCSLGRNFTLTLGHNVGTLTLSNLAGSGFATEIEIEIKQDGTGGRTFALPAAFKALGGSDTAIASAANAVTVLSAKTFDNGTTWRYAMQESA